MKQIDYRKDRPHMKVTLRQMTLDDLPLFKKWLYTPHVAKWYHHPINWITEVEKQYKEFNWVHHFIAEYEGKPIGFCQYYACKDSDENWFEYTKAPGAYSIDYLIGEKDYVGRGFGKAMVIELLQTIKACYNSPIIIVQPEAENIASRSLLLSCGFNHRLLNDVFVLSMA